MPTGSAIVAKLKDLEPIEGADRIVQAKIYGETIIVSKDHEEGELGILFDMETQLSHEFCHNNNLYRHSELNKDKKESGYIEDNRRVKPIRLKGVQTSGFWMPIESLSFVYNKESYGGTLDLKEGTQFTEFNGTEICKKYVPKHTKQQGSGGKKKEGRVSMKDLVPTFKEHFDTDHWARNKHKIKESDLVIITEKLHGTSFRCGNLPILKFRKGVEKFAVKVMHILFGKRWRNDYTQYEFVVGSRRTVKSIDGNEREEAQHYYDSDLWTEVGLRHFKGKLEKGETIYGELVGYTPQGKPIMGTHSNEKLKPFMDKKEYKEFIDRYGKETIFHYGCTNNSLTRCQAKLGVDLEAAPINKLYVYRITRTNEDGESIDLSWEQVKQRCEILGVDYVPELVKFLSQDFHLNSNGRGLDTVVNSLTESPSKNFPQHLNEGICIRVENGGLTPMVFKNKNYYFRVLEGQIKEPTMEDDN